MILHDAACLTLFHFLGYKFVTAVSCWGPEGVGFKTDNIEMILGPLTSFMNFPIFLKLELFITEFSSFHFVICFLDMRLCYVGR